MGRLQLRVLCFGAVLWTATGTVSGQASAAYFDAPIVVDAATATAPIRLLADFDGDGLKDLITASHSGGLATLTGLRSLGDGRFAMDWTTTFSLVATSPVFHGSAAHLNADAFEDFVIASPGGVRWYLAAGAGSPPTLMQTTTFGAIASIAVGDLSGDGLDDVAAASGTSVTVWINAAGGAVAWPVVTAPATVLDLSVEDLDGVPPADLAVLQATALRLHSSTPGGPAPAAVVSFPLNIVNPFNTPDPTKNLLTFGDLDADEDRDFVASDGGGWVWGQRTAPTSFTVASTGLTSEIRTLLDIDGDGDLDGVSYFSPAFYISRNTGTGVSSLRLIPDSSNSSVSGRRNG